MCLGDVAFVARLFGARCSASRWNLFLRRTASSVEAASSVSKSALNE